MKITTRTIAALWIVGACLGACVSPEQVARNRAEVEQAATALADAKGHARVMCKDRQECDKAFSLARIYVEKNADTKVQTSDDTIIATVNPIEYGNVALRAVKKPGANASGSIELNAVCKGSDDNGHFFKICAQKIAPIYDGFKPSIEQQLQ